MVCNRFHNGGFVLHKIMLGEYKGKFSAWYDATGKLLAAEQIALGYGWTRSVKTNGPAWQRLATIGPAWVE